MTTNSITQDFGHITHARKKLEKQLETCFRTFLALANLDVELVLKFYEILEIFSKKKGLENTRFPSPWQKHIPFAAAFFLGVFPTNGAATDGNSMPGRSSKVKRPRQKSTSFSAMAFRNTYQKMTAIQVIQVVAVKIPLSWRSLRPLKGHNHTKKVTLNHQDLVLVADCLEFAKNCGGTDSGPPPKKKTLLFIQ